MKGKENRVEQMEEGAEKNRGRGKGKKNTNERI